MKKFNLSATIDAPKKNVWMALWEDASYRQWTSPFMEGSYAVTENWKEGTKVLFLAPGGSGMVSMVAANKPEQFMSFKHLGEVTDGVEDTSSDKVKQWAGATENYTLTEKDGKTELNIEMDISEEWEHLEKTWPAALGKLKELAEAGNQSPITVIAEIESPVEKVWEYWTAPEHIVQWCYASDDWHAPLAENDVRNGGKFKTVMAAKDGSYSFDFGGEYTEVAKHKVISYILGDGRKVDVHFEKNGDKTRVIETFDPEQTNSRELQRGGWQAILNNFKKYSEKNS